MKWKNLIRSLAGYFVNGLVISMAFTALSLIFFGILTLLLVVFGGYLNGILARYVWNLEVKSDVWEILKQGVFVYIAALVVNFLVVVLPLEAYYSIPMVAIVLIVQSFVLGYPCRLIAEHYEEDEELTPPDTNYD